MGKHDKIVWRILKATSDSNIAFYDLCNLLIYLGFKMRTKGSHHIFRKPGVTEKINIQKDGSKAKPYQVKQVRDLILKYKFGDKIKQPLRQTQGRQSRNQIS